jgi:hypothetical protein
METCTVVEKKDKKRSLHDLCMLIARKISIKIINLQYICARKVKEIYCIFAIKAYCV